MAKPLFAGNVLDEFREVYQRKNEGRTKQTVDLRGKRILLAEDVTVNAEIMMELLDMRGIAADHAENGRIAAELFAASAPGYYDAVVDVNAQSSFMCSVDVEPAQPHLIVGPGVNCFLNEVVHISVTASWKKAGLFSPVGGVLQAARHSERKFSQAMTGRAYRGGEAEPAQLGGRSAARYCCRYTVEGVEMTGITLVAGSRRHIYYLHGYYQTAYEKDCLPVWEALVESAAWQE